MTVLDNVTFAPIELGRESKEEAQKHGMELLEKLDFRIKPKPILTAFLAAKNNVLPLHAA